MTQICNPVGEQCFNCEDYTEAFACLDKTKISQMPELSELELGILLDSECDDIRVPAAVVPCNGTPYNISVSLKDLGKGGGGTPIGFMQFSEFDFGDKYGCWLKVNETQILTRTEYPDLFTAANIAGDSYTFNGKKGQYPLGAGAGICNAGQIVGNQNSSITLGCEHLPSCQIQINDPKHTHNAIWGGNRDAEGGDNKTTLERKDAREAQTQWPVYVEPAATGITATHKVGQGGNGNPVAIDVKPWSFCGYWYLKVSNDCD